MNERLQQLAQAAGVDVAVKPCAACAGEGSRLRPDPLDLRRLREAAGVSRFAFARTAGVSPGFITMVEDPNPDPGRPCPEWLLEQYLLLSHRDRPAPTDQGAVLRAMPDAERRRHLADAQVARRNARAARRRAQHRLIARGQIWERLQPARPKRVVEVCHVGENYALVRPEGDVQTPRAITFKTLRRDYRCLNLE